MNEQVNQLLLSVLWNRLLRCTVVLIYLLSKVSACLKFKLLESFNLSVFGPHVKFQPTSNESLIKQTRNSMWNDCQLPRGRMWIWRPEDATLTELRAPKRSLTLPKEKQGVPRPPPKKPTAKFREPSSLPFVSVLCVMSPHSLCFTRMIPRLEGYGNGGSSTIEKIFTSWEGKKDSTVSLSEIILASQKPLLPLKLISWSREGSWDSASSHSYRVSHQKAPGIAPAGTPSKPCLHHLWLFSPHTCQKTVPSLGECRELPFHKEPPANFGWRRATLYIAKELGLPAKGI